MKFAGVFVLGALCGGAVMVIPRAIAHLRAAAHAAHRPTSAGEARTHTHEQFEFTANATMDQLAPLFGADKERVWAEGWNPRFLFPQPLSDKEGMVFTIDNHHGHAVWVNTELDLRNGRIQYVYVVPDVMATLITLRLTSVGDKTRAAVIYERTALSPGADDPVRHMAEGDRRSGPEWEVAVNSYLSKVGR